MTEQRSLGLALARAVVIWMTWRAPPDLLRPQAVCHLCCITDGLAFTTTTPEGTIHPFSSGTYHQYSEDRPILDSKPSLSCSKSQAGFLGVYPHHTEGSRERC